MTILLSDNEFITNNVESISCNTLYIDENGNTFSVHGCSVNEKEVNIIYYKTAGVSKISNKKWGEKIKYRKYYGEIILRNE